MQKSFANTEIAMLYKHIKFYKTYTTDKIGPDYYSTTTFV